MNSLIVGKDQRLVVLQQTVGGVFDSIPTQKEAEYYISLDTYKQSKYLQEIFFNLGFAEGANNLVAISEALKSYKWEELVLVIEEV